MAVSKKQSARLRNVAVVSLVLLVFYGFLLHSDQDLGSSRPKTTAEFDDSPATSYGNHARKQASRQKLSSEELNNRFMTSKQCATTFPGLTKEIDDVVAKGPFTLTKTGDLGPLIARVKDGKVCCLASLECTGIERVDIGHVCLSVNISDSIL